MLLFRQAGDLKKRIESLIDRDYLCRDKTDNNTYNYVAWTYVNFNDPSCDFFAQIVTMFNWIYFLTNNRSANVSVDGIRIMRGSRKLSVIWAT